MAENPYDGAEGRPLLDLVIAGMAVVDRDGTRVGMVDKVEGSHLKILRLGIATKSLALRNSPRDRPYSRAGIGAG